MGEIDHHRRSEGTEEHLRGIWEATTIENHRTTTSSNKTRGIRRIRPRRKTEKTSVGRGSRASGS